MTPNEFVRQMRQLGIADASMEDLGGRVLHPSGTLADGSTVNVGHADDSDCIISAPDEEMEPLVSVEHVSETGLETYDVYGPCSHEEALAEIARRNEISRMG